MDDAVNQSNADLLTEKRATAEFTIYRRNKKYWMKSKETEYFSLVLTFGFTSALLHSWRSNNNTSKSNPQTSCTTYHWHRARVTADALWRLTDRLKLPQTANRPLVISPNQLVPFVRCSFMDKNNLLDPLKNVNVIFSSFTAKWTTQKPVSIIYIVNGIFIKASGQRKTCSSITTHHNIIYRSCFFYYIFHSKS